MAFSALQVGKKRSDVVWIISDIIFPVSYVVFPASDVVFGVFGKKWEFRFFCSITGYFFTTARTMNHTCIAVARIMP